MDLCFPLANWDYHEIGQKYVHYVFVSLFFSNAHERWTGTKWKVSNEKTEQLLKWDDLWTKIKGSESSPGQERQRKWVIVFKYAVNSYYVNINQLTSIDILVVL